MNVEDYLQRHQQKNWSFMHLTHQQLQEYIVIREIPINYASKELSKVEERPQLHNVVKLPKLSHFHF